MESVACAIQQGSGLKIDPEKLGYGISSRAASPMADEQVSYVHLTGATWAGAGSML
jgi:hypothetical protein